MPSLAVDPAVTLAARPVTLAADQVLPLLPALGHLVPWEGLARGVTVACAGAGATSLALALVSEASRAGSWVAVVGWPGLGCGAVAGSGVCLERLILVPAPPEARRVDVLAALVGAVDVVLVGPAAPPPPGPARRLGARARERATTLVLAGSSWPAPTDLVLSVDRQTWVGLGAGHGHLQGRRVRVTATGRGRAARARTAQLWLPDEHGQVRPAPVTGHPGRPGHPDRESLPPVTRRAGPVPGGAGLRSLRLGSRVPDAVA